MRYFFGFLLLSVFGCRSVVAQVDSTTIPNSENGWYLSPHGTIRVLVLFAEIEHDKNPGKNPANDAAEHWPKGQLPTWKDNLFDPLPSAQPTAMITRYFHDVSLGDYTVLGDYVDRMFTLKESEYAEVGSAHSIGSVTVKEANKRMDSLITKHGLRIADFDLWQDGGKAGLPKVNKPDSPHKYDHVMVIARNSGLTHGQGSTDQGSPGRLWGYESDTQSRFGGMNALPFEILKHEYNHLLLGGNNFHSGGGNAAQFDSYTLCMQGGWSLMGAANSSLLTCSAWDRDRLGWKGQGAPYRVNAHDPSNAFIDADLDPIAGDTGLFILKDFVTTGDALRIRMPFLPEGEYRQWLWVENHQTFSHNGSPTDLFHWENSDVGCVSDATPGLFMTMQIEREEKRGKDVFGGSADYLHPLTASGHYDVVITDDTIRPSCPFNGEARAYRLEDRWQDPLSGNCEQELVVFDRNGDGKVERGEHYVMGSGYRPDGSIANDAAFFGAARHAWRANGNRVLGIGSNPSSANMLTLGCSAKKERNSGKAPDNRTVYLNGIRVELVEQRANGDIAVRISTGETRLAENIRWCADSIVLPPLQGKDGRSLTVLAGKRLLIDRSRTPTRMALQEEVKGVRYFAPATRFTISSGATVKLEANSELRLENGSIIHVMPGADISLDPSAKLSVDASSRIVLHGNAQLQGKARMIKKLKKKKRIRSVA
ncbi:MAG: hypothetical protein IPP33_13050 [Flavobacteriales bacterium]|nr:hypothetical protein [Flavobacteriales bacterium]